MPHSLQTLTCGVTPAQLCHWERGARTQCQGSNESMLKAQLKPSLLGVDDAMPLIVWTRHFLMAQGHEVHDNVIHQDNQSAMLLERNGRASSGRRTRHINMRHFFVADRIRQKEMRVEHCPTGDMLADLFTKPLQGSQFRKLRDLVLGISNDALKANPQASQECVGTMSHADAVRRTDLSNATHDARASAKLARRNQQQR